VVCDFVLEVREAALPDDEDAPAAGRLNHLFLDQEVAPEPQTRRSLLAVDREVGSLEAEPDGPLLHRLNACRQCGARFVVSPSPKLHLDFARWAP